MAYSVIDMYAWAIAKCNEANIAYNQSYRTMQVDPDTGCTCFDCSSFTFFAMWLGGGLDIGSLGYSTNLSDYTSIPRTANAWTVNSMVQKLRSLNWVQVGSNAADWLPGDILVKTSTHCEIVYSINPLQSMGARNPRLPLAEQVAIHTLSNPAYYDQVWRDPTSPAPPGPGPRPHGHMPVWLLKKALEGGIF